MLKSRTLRRAFNAATKTKTRDPNTLGKLGQEFLEAFYKGKGKPTGLMKTELGGRVPDLARPRMIFKDIIAEVKNRPIGAQETVLLQLQKDADLAAKYGYKIEWHLLKGTRQVGRKGTFLETARKVAERHKVNIIIYDYTR